MKCDWTLEELHKLYIRPVDPVALPSSAPKGEWDIVDVASSSDFSDACPVRSISKGYQVWKNWIDVAVEMEEVAVVVVMGGL